MSIQSKCPARLMKSEICDRVVQRDQPNQGKNDRKPNVRIGLFISNQGNLNENKLLETHKLNTN